MEKIIRVTGRGIVKLARDKTIVRMNYSGTRRKYENAVEESAQRTRQLKDLIEKAGFDPKDLKTTDYRVNSAYDYKNNTSIFIGYRYTTRCEICFPTDNKTLGRLLTALSNCDAGVEFSVDFGMMNTEDAKLALIANAVNDAKKKAEVLAVARGVKLGDVQNIDYSFGEIDFYSHRNYRFDDFCEGEMLMKNSIDIDIEPEDISVTDTVTVIWSIS